MIGEQMFAYQGLKTIKIKRAREKLRKTEREMLRPERVPQGEWHGQQAEQQVGDGQDDDEVVPCRAHHFLADDGIQDDAVARHADEDNQAVQEAQDVQDHRTVGAG